MISEKHKKRMFEMIHWIKYWSSCPSGRQHACIIAVDGKFIISTGYNDVCKGEVCKVYIKCIGGKPLPKECESIHAEENALLNLLKIGYASNKNLFAFVTKKPCTHCRNLLKNAGIKKVFWFERKYYAGDGKVQREIYGEEILNAL